MLIANATLLDGASVDVRVGHVIEVVASTLRGLIPQYLEKWVYGVSSHQEMLDKLVGAHKLKEIVGRATIKEGYNA